MKFNDEFIDLLKNFSTINTQMMFIEGKKQSTLALAGTIFASIETDVEIEKPFAILELPKFLSILSLFDEPEIELDEKEKFLTISSGSKSVSYQLTNPDFIHFEKNPDKFSKMKEKLSFKMDFADYSAIKKIGSILKSQELVFHGDGSKVWLMVTNANDNGDSGKVVLDDTDQVFKVVLKVDKMKLCDTDYKVRISDKGAVHFKADKIEYYIAPNKDKSTI